MGTKERSSNTKLWIFRGILIALLACWIGHPQPQLDLENDILPLARKYAATSSTSQQQQQSNTPLEGVRVAITGATSGIGLGLVKQFVAMGATVIAMGRSTKKLKALQDEMEQGPTSTVGGTVRTVQVQLADLESVKAASEEIASQFDSIDILINNAGIHYTGYSSGNEEGPPKTPQNIDMSFGVNYVSHFLLTEKMVPLLQNSTFHPIIVQVSSSYHWAVDGSQLMIPTTTSGGDGEVETNPISAIPGGLKGIFAQQRAYGNSKLAQILHARALQRRLATTKGNSSSTIRVKSICPCWVGTSIGGKGKEWLLGQVAFPYDGFGLKSTLLAALDTTTTTSSSTTTTEDDYYTNSPLTKLPESFPNQIFDSWAFRWYLRDFVLLNFANLLMGIQKFSATAVATRSSPESYNETLQEELYHWTYKIVQPYL